MSKDQSNTDLSKYVKLCHSNLTENVRAHLISKRMLSAEIIDAFSIGVDGKRITIPVTDENGSVVDIRLYLPEYERTEKKQAKVMSHKNGDGSPKIFPSLTFDLMRLKRYRDGKEAIEDLETLERLESFDCIFKKILVWDFVILAEGELDPTRTKQVLMNLVGNALKFTKVGSVKITLSGYEGNDGAKCCAFEVIDSGVGIPEASIERLFKMFTQADNSMTRKYGGTGLGLALSRSLARAMGGNVRLVKTEIDKGSTFHFSIESREDLLPAIDVNEPVFPKKADPDFGPDTLKDIRVLLVEDSPDNQQLIWRYLSKFGAHIEIADNGLEGVAKAMAGEHDLILMDLQMPVMDGYTAVGKLRSKGYKKPIVALTAHAMSDVQKKCQDVGCTDHLSKPINPKEMVETIVKLTRLRGS